MKSTADIPLILQLVKHLALERVNILAIFRLAGYRNATFKKQGYADANADWLKVLDEIIEELQGEDIKTIK